jgi:O-antigen ligase
MRGWRGPVLAALVVIVAACAAYVASDSLQKRVNEVGADLSQWRPGANDSTSVGQRLEYYRTTLAIIADHPVLGVGTGAFAQAYAEKIRGTQGHATVNPHNDYLLIAAQVGLPALIVLLALYALIWHYAAGLATPLERDLARGLVIAIAVGGVFNSLLLDHTEGLLFAWLTAVLYAGYNRPHSPAEAHA